MQQETIDLNNVPEIISFDFVSFPYKITPELH